MRDSPLLLRGLARAFAWCFAGAIVILSLVPPALRPETGAPHDLEHFIPYFVTGVAFSLGYPRKTSLLAAYLIVFCGLVELTQMLVPGRHARLSDFMVDALAVVLGVAIVLVLPARSEQPPPA